MLPDDSSSESECESDADGSSCSSSSDSDVFDVIAEIKRKKAHPDRLHEELWYNDPGQVRLTLTQPLLGPNRKKINWFCSGLNTTLRWYKSFKFAPNFPLICFGATFVSLCELNLRSQTHKCSKTTGLNEPSSCLCPPALPPAASSGLAEGWGSGEAFNSHRA